MIDNLDIANTTLYLFDCDFFADDFDPDGREEHLERSDALLESNSWNDVFAAWNDYLHNNCKTAESVINYCNLFIYYGGQDHFIPNPYDFLGYIYYRVDIDKYWNSAGELIDGLCISVLEKSGDISTVSDPYYQSWKDPKILASVKKYQNKNK